MVGLVIVLFALTGIPKFFNDFTISRCYVIARLLKKITDIEKDLSLADFTANEQLSFAAFVFCQMTPICRYKFTTFDLIISGTIVQCLPFIVCSTA